jgi:hypothetical protein
MYNTDRFIFSVFFGLPMGWGALQFRIFRVSRFCNHYLFFSGVSGEKIKNLELDNNKL